jgi:RHH-type rel operon transcriptional repressor/antitoxin RelB
LTVFVTYVTLVTRSISVFWRLAEIRGWFYKFMTEKAGTTVVRIPRALDERLGDFAAKTGRRKTYYVSKAIECYLEDLEDYHDAKEALKKSKRTYTLDEVARKLGLDY